VLRHENAVLRRHAGRIQYELADRLWFAALAPLPPPALNRHLPRDARDAAGLAPQAGSEKVRHERAAQARPPADGPGASPRAARARPGGSSWQPRPPGSSRSTSCTQTPCCGNDYMSWCSSSTAPAGCTSAASFALTCGSL